MVRFNAGLGIGRARHVYEEKTSPCYTVIVLLVESLLERSLSIRMAIVCPWSQLHGQLAGSEECCTT